MPPNSPWTIQLFGGLRITGPSCVIERFPTRRSALLLARVALARSGSVGRDDLAGALWPDDYLDATRLRLRQELNRLRETLGDAAGLIHSDRSWIQLDLANVQVDTREFDRLLSVMRAENDLAIKSQLRIQALELYGGPLLPEQTEDWVQAERQDFHAKHLATLIEHTDQLLTEGRHQEALASALKAVRSDPYHEPARTSAMRAFADMGDIGGAMRQFIEYEKALQREFAARPSESIQQLVADIRKRAGASPSAAIPAEPQPVAAPAPERRASPLPVYLDRLVGREKEKALLGKLFTEDPVARLATITGPGGVGKTRLAVAVSAEVAPHFGGSVVFVGLADIEPGQRVLTKIQEEFGGLVGPGEAEPIPGWGTKPCLLVLDNAEHVLEDAQRAAKDILLAHPSISILATSRQKLALGGEQEIPLSPLAVPELSHDESEVATSPAAELFLERARAVRPGYEVPDEQAEPFVLLLDRLDGLPLAIELAAARIGFLTPDQMLDEIDDRFTFLVSRRADVGSRQRSLRATIDWSFRGLDPIHKEVLELLAAFRGGWTIELARKATCRSDIVDLLQDLVERSLIHREDSAGDARFMMLDSIRHYVLTEASAERVHTARGRHAEVMAEHLFMPSRRLTGADQNQWYDFMRNEIDNGRTAIEWAAEHDPASASKLGTALWRFWSARGSSPEGAQYLDKVLQKLPDEVDVFWAESTLGRGILSLVGAVDDKATYWMAKAAELFEKIGDTEAVGWSLMNLAHGLIEESRIHEAYAVADRAMQMQIVGLIPYIQDAMCRALPRMGRTEEALRLAEEAFAQNIRQNGPTETGRSYSQLADIYADCGRYEGVRGLLIEAVERLHSKPIQDFLLYALISLSIEEQRLGNDREFEEAIGEAGQIALHTRNFRGDAIVKSLTARQLSLSGEHAKAFRMYEAAIRPIEHNGASRIALRTARMFASDLAQAGQHDAARGILGAEAGFRATLDCGLSPNDEEDRSKAIRIVGEVEPMANVRTHRELVAKLLAFGASAK